MIKENATRAKIRRFDSNSNESGTSPEAEPTLACGSKGVKLDSILGPRLAPRKDRFLMSTSTIKIEVAPGELLDKLTILAIKLERIEDPGKRANVKVEFDVLDAARRDALPHTTELERLIGELRAANEALWDIEDQIRDCEREKDFGPRFVELARAVYHTNDRRAAIKKAINLHLGSHLVEEKSYSAY